MSLSDRLIEAYEDRKPSLSDLPPTFQRPAHLAIPRSSTPLARPPSRNFGNLNGMNPDESWMSHHGGQQSFMSVPPGSTQGTSSWSEERIQMLQARLRRKLGPEYVTQRPGPGGSAKLSYIEGWKVINLANEVFGFNGWSSSIVSLKTDYLDEKEGGRVSVNVTAIIRITLQDGCSHEDVGCGQGENIRGKSAALDKAQKEAVTDATKRALRTFGNVLGNCLYDKEYTKEVVKMKVPPAKFNQADLERRPEFTPAGVAGPSNVPQQQQPRPAISIQQPQPIRPQAMEPPIIAPGTPLRSINDTAGDVFMDENFDAEFMDIGSDSFLDQIDESSMQTGPVNGNGSMNGKSYPQNAQAGPSRQPQQLAQPAYQHRHRPDMPNGAQTSKPPVTEDQDQTPSGQVGSKPSSGNSAGSGLISNGSAKTLNEASKPRPVGGFAISGGGNAAVKSAAIPNPDAAAAAALARRQAITSALNSVNTSSSPPIRAGSPKIPSGGIDTVAARANNKLRNDGVSLKLNTNGINDEGENVVMGGFASARGIKRNVENERRSASPTKPSSYERGQHGFNRQANRTALGELTASGAEDYNAKRSRVG
ncbi:uncharacterized protein L201_000095 [Kwoniella dendrophila CBS 6074]|uniref:DNA repair and recombination protein RAD52 n=1 Tax=Kwoniella dendrophila CBS 6074 TaxID=1295534 RepID=A0AAX4JK22_9TREE